MARSDIIPHIKRIHVLWHSWELKSIPKQELHNFTSKQIHKQFEADFPQAKIFVTFDGEPVKGIDLEIDTTAGEDDPNIMYVYGYLAEWLRTWMNQMQWADAHHRAPFLVKPRADQLRYASLR